MDRIIEPCLREFLFGGQKSLLEGEDALETGQCCRAQRWQKTIIHASTVSVPLDRSLVVLPGDADRYPIMDGIPRGEAVHGPVVSKKGSSFLEDPADLIFPETVFLGYHARGLRPTCFSLRLVLLVLPFSWR